MHESEPTEAERMQLRVRALSRWENDGGTVCGLLPPPAKDLPGSKSSPPLADAELVQLRIRVIALENLVIALLAEAPPSQLERVREMAAYITPRPGFTAHPMTIGAAAEILSLVDRAAPFRSMPPADL